MNVMPTATDFDAASVDEADLVDVEQALLAHCLVRAEKISEAATKVSPTDFAHPFHRAIFSALLELSEAGRRPSVEALVARFGDDELEPGLTPRTYLTKLFRGALYGALATFPDAVETLRDVAMRRKLADAGACLLSQSTNQYESLADIATRAVATIDDVLSGLRAGARRHYDGEEAGRIALAHLDSTTRPYPTTGLVDLDKMTGGWPRGQFSVVAGRPGMGKSAVASSALLRAAKAGHASMFFSLEMVGEQLGARILTDLAFTHNEPVYYEDILHRRAGAIGAFGRRRLDEAARRLTGLPIAIEEQRGLTFAEIAARARKTANAMDRAGQHLEVIFVDHMLLVQPSGRYAGNRVNEVREISSGLATLAKELDVAMVALCQLNRGVEGRENKRPALSDLRDSGAIEEDASLVIMLYRAVYYLEAQRCENEETEKKRTDNIEKYQNTLEFIVAKNRNGRCGTVDAFINIGANAVRDKAFAG